MIPGNRSGLLRRGYIAKSRPNGDQASHYSIDDPPPIGWAAADNQGQDNSPNAKDAVDDDQPHRGDDDERRNQDRANPG